MNDSKKIQPSQRCPSCGAWVDKAELSTNGGKCNHCTPAYSVTVRVQADGRAEVVRDGK